MDNRVEINLFGSTFMHSVSSCDLEPKYIKWVKNETASSNISVYVDDALLINVNKNTINYGWLAESKTINIELYNWCFNNIEFLKKKFKCVFTHDVSLTEISDFFVLTQTSGKSPILGEIYPKTKLISMIASNKTACSDHIFRQEIINQYKDKLDHYGRGFRNSLINKVDGLRDYCFSLTMENGTYSNMYTEKITDCFMTGTIPIYYGINNIGDFFNIDGIILFDNNFRIEELSFDLYNSKLEAVKENYKIASEMLCAEDYIYVNYIKKWLNLN